MMIRRLKTVLVLMLVAAQSSALSPKLEDLFRRAGVSENDAGFFFFAAMLDQPVAWAPEGVVQKAVGDIPRADRAEFRKKAAALLDHVGTLRAARLSEIGIDFEDGRENLPRFLLAQTILLSAKEHDKALVAKAHGALLRVARNPTAAPALQYRALKLVVETLPSIPPMETIEDAIKALSGLRKLNPVERSLAKEVDSALESLPRWLNAEKAAVRQKFNELGAIDYTNWNDRAKRQMFRFWSRFPVIPEGAQLQKVKMQLEPEEADVNAASAHWDRLRIQERKLWEARRHGMLRRAIASVKNAFATGCDKTFSALAAPFRGSRFLVTGPTAAFVGALFYVNSFGNPEDVDPAQAFLRRSEVKDMDRSLRALANAYMLEEGVLQEIPGSSKSADQLCHALCQQLHVETRTVWERHGKRAGPMDSKAIDTHLKSGRAGSPWYRIAREKFVVEVLKERLKRFEAGTDEDFELHDLLTPEALLDLPLEQEAKLLAAEEVARKVAEEKRVADLKAAEERKRLQEAEDEARKLAAESKQFFQSNSDYEALRNKGNQMIAEADQKLRASSMEQSLRTLQEIQAMQDSRKEQAMLAKRAAQRRTDRREQEARAITEQMRQIQAMSGGQTPEAQMQLNQLYMQLVQRFRTLQTEQQKEDRQMRSVQGGAGSGPGQLRYNELEAARLRDERLKEAFSNPAPTPEDPPPPKRRSPAVRELLKEIGDPEGDLPEPPPEPRSERNSGYPDDLRKALESMEKAKRKSEDEAEALNQLLRALGSDNKAKQNSSTPSLPPPPQPNQGFQWDRIQPKASPARGPLGSRGRR